MASKPRALGVFVKVYTLQSLTGYFAGLTLRSTTAIHRFRWRWSAKVSRWMLSGSKAFWPETNKSCFTVTAGYPEEHFLRRTKIGNFS